MMRAIHRLILCAVTWASMSSLATADDIPCPISFGDLQQTLALQFNDLLSSRGLPQPEDFLRGREVADGVIEFLSHPQRTDDDRDRALLIYVSSGETMCVAVWSSQSLDPPMALRVEGSTARIVTLIESLGPAIRSGSRTRATEAPLRGGEPRSRGPSLVQPARASADVIAELQSMLFPDSIRDQLHDLAALYIAPAANIATVPFSLLDIDGDGVPLVETTSVTIVPSLRDVVTQPILFMGPVTGRVSVFGDPDATGDPDWSFPRLPAARLEAEAVARTFSAVPVIGDEATVETALSQMVGAEYIHIAAHGYSDALDPLDGSFIAFTNGRLTARQLQTIGVAPHAIAVMSACQTGLGGVHEAGIIGLARAFIVAGSAAVVASLWNVDDEATAFMMERFAVLLGENDPAEALRIAQVETRARWPDPLYWAPFTTFGYRILSAH